MTTMKKSLAVLAAFATTLVATLAAADSSTEPRPGSKGSVTAYESDGKTVIHVRACARDAHGGHDYPTCGAALRSEVHTLMCSRGKGAHTWMYQIADSKPSVQTASCR